MQNILKNLIAPGRSNLILIYSTYLLLFVKDSHFVVLTNLVCIFPLIDFVLNIVNRKKSNNLILRLHYKYLLKLFLISQIAVFILSTIMLNSGERYFSTLRFMKYAVYGIYYFLLIAGLKKLYIQKCSE